MTDDAYWRRPSGGEPEQDGNPAAHPAPEPPYTGPPPTERPSYRAPAPLIQPLPPPRQLPEQDTAALDAEEQRARTVTLGVAILGGALLVLLMVAVAVRAGVAG